MKRELKILAVMAAVFLAAYFMPVGWARFDNALREGLELVKWYAREHVLLCLVPAFFIAGAISVFVSQASVMRYLGPSASKPLAYGVASVSGAILAVCSCTVLPLFTGIYRMGAGLGPASAFLYSGPAINVLAIVLTWRVLGAEIGLARAIGAILFSVVIGLLMHLVFRRSEAQKALSQAAIPAPAPRRALWKNALFFAAMVATLVFANWARSGQVKAAFLCCPGGLAVYQVEGTVLAESKEQVRILDTGGMEHEIPADQLKDISPAPASSLSDRIHAWRFVIVAASLAALVFMLARWFSRAEIVEWAGASWSFAKQIMPLLLGGVLLAGVVLGRPGQEGLMPSRWVESAVGGNSLRANFFASLAGALMYFATLTEVPIVQGLVGSGMGKGPALALLLAGPALSLPSILVLHSVMGLKKTAVYCLLVVVMATATGLIFGAI